MATSTFALVILFTKEDLPTFGYLTGLGSAQGLAAGNVAPSHEEGAGIGVDGGQTRQMLPHLHHGDMS